MTTPPSPVIPRNYSLRKRIIGGGIIAGVIGLGIWLGSQLGLGPGLGSGDGRDGEEGSGTEQSSNANDQDDAARDEATENDSEERTIAASGEPPLHVLIDGTEYSIGWHDEENRVPASLEQIVEIAVNIPPNPDESRDLRVLIEHTVTAETGAHTDLRDALRQAGLAPETQFASVREPVITVPQ